MSIKAEETLNEIRYAGGFYSDKPISTTSSFAAASAVVDGSMTSSSLTSNVAYLSTAYITGVLTAGTISARSPIISGSGATKDLTIDQSGSIVLMDRAAGIVFTLPTATPGTYFEFIATVSVTTNAYKIITAVGTELLIGDLLSIDSDTSNAIAAWTGNGSTHIAVNMAGTTKGGLIGTHLVLTCLTATQWLVKGSNIGSGTVETPFATS